MSSNASRPTDDEIEYVINEYTDMLYRVCLTMLRTPSDAEDAVQEVVMRYIEKVPKLSDEEHRKAWLLKVAVNLCKNALRFRAMHPHTGILEIERNSHEWRDNELLVLLMNLPLKYKSVMYLHYVEEYKVKEISSIVKISENAVRKRLQRGRELLRKEYFGNDEGEKSDERH